MRAYIFGASGQIGSAIKSHLESESYETFAFSSKSNNDSLIDTSTSTWCGHVAKFPADCVVWANGVNLNDSIENMNIEATINLLNANLIYILENMNLLVRNSLLRPNASIIILSSVWQDISRPNKLSYTISKSAINGLINSLAIDLGRYGYRVNAILPGVIDTPMTRANLSDEQIIAVSATTPRGSLVTIAEISTFVEFLCSEKSSGINGQSITIDAGWSKAKYV